VLPNRLFRPDRRREHSFESDFVKGELAMSRTLKIATVVVALAAISPPAIAHAQSYSPNYSYNWRDPASRPYDYRGYADQGYAPPERGSQGANFW
jgi:hypothetical protein